uniref:Uncharacterized protein n=1 Tax=Anguilla anguilla TaxID=7936 RepID=A0A0E9U8N4_ANGAN
MNGSSYSTVPTKTRRREYTV